MSIIASSELTATQYVMLLHSSIGFFVQDHATNPTEGVLYLAGQFGLDVGSGRVALPTARA
jgi:hypothetical protein